MKRRTDGLSSDAVSSLRRSLIGWFAREKRALPWRKTRDPYRVWISEAMLQQTRVETVLPYYERFLDRFPTVEALARARLEDVLAAWSGLGYYRRAHSLQAAAQLVVERHRGRFPSDREGLLELPGVGAYTAGAIASIAFDRPEPLVDGNVARVLCRLFGLDGDPASAEQRRKLWSLARSLVPTKGAADWNQALMELGALVCTPREPRCDGCPLASRCMALREGRVPELPRRKPRRAPVSVEIVVLAVTDGDRWLLERRPARGRMAGLWQMPTIEVPRGRPRGGGRARGGSPRPGGAGTRDGLLFPLHRPSVLREKGTLCEVRHAITHHRIHAVVKRGILSSREPVPPLAWFPRRGLAEIALTGMTRKCLAAILAAQSRTAVTGSPRSRRSAPSSSTRHSD